MCLFQKGNKHYLRALAYQHYYARTTPNRRKTTTIKTKKPLSQGLRYKWAQNGNWSTGISQDFAVTAQRGDTRRRQKLKRQLFLNVLISDCTEATVFGQGPALACCFGSNLIAANASFLDAYGAKTTIYHGLPCLRPR